MPDGRRLAYTEWGIPDGKPVLYFHGGPGCRLWCPDEEATSAAGVRLIIPDRPGIGRSDPLEGRTLADWPKDVEALADALKISSFAIVGVSGGGPYAAGCAALIPERLDGVAIVSSRPLTKYDWAERPGAAEDWSPRARTVRAGSERPGCCRTSAAEQSAQNSVRGQVELPELVREQLEAAEGDRWFFEDASRTAIFYAHIKESWRQGLDAIKWELIDMFQPWGFRMADISMPVTIWRGSQDPAHQTRRVPAEPIRQSSLVIWPDCGHLGFAKHWGELLEAV